MFALRFLVLMFLVAYSWGMGQISAGGLNAFGTVVAMSFFVVAPALYFLPTFEAWRRGHPNIGAIAALNTFLGWSLIGWVVAVVWAFKRPEPQIKEGFVPASAVSVTRKCPFCAEEIKGEAIKCKHCGSAVESIAQETGAPAVEPPAFVPTDASPLALANAGIEQRGSSFVWRGQAYPSFEAVVAAIEGARAVSA